MRPACRLFKKSPSSSRWLQRQSNDPYVRQRTSPTSSSSLGSDTYRSRSAFKLVSLAKSYPSITGRGKVVIDLGAAPGGWSQVAVNKGSKVVAVDLIDMDPIRGVDFVQGNFLDDNIRKKVESLTGGKGVDTVLSDMMASMTGVRDRDVQASLDLVAAATSFGIQTLKHSQASEEEVEPVVDGRGAKVYTGGNMV